MLVRSTSLAVRLGTFVALAALAMPHGSIYPGTPATRPPAPAPPGPMAPAPVRAGPAFPQAPSAPSGPTTPGPHSGGPAAGTGPSTGLLDANADLSHWSVWWRFNKDPYLELKRALHDGSILTGDETSGDPRVLERARTIYRPSPESVRTKVVPALERALEKERSNDIVTGALIAIARIGAGDSSIAESAYTRIVARLADPNQEIAETASVALGLLGDARSVETLAALFTDSAAGRELVRAKEVSYRTRAFAAYGLGLVGNRAVSNRTRQMVARVLTDLLTREAGSTQDVEVAAVIALGLVPLDLDPRGAETSATAWSSRQGVLRYLLRVLADGSRRNLVRAHVPTALVRLCAGVPAALEAEVEDTLLALLRSGKPSNELLQSATLALGGLGDSDRERGDIEIRAQLKRLSDVGDQQVRAFALISLAHVGSRPGSGDGNDFGSNECRNFLINLVVRGKSRMRSWAAIALGVMERTALDRSAATSPTVREVLRSALAASASAEEVGAYSIALGLCRDVDATRLLEKRLLDARDEGARGYLCVSLGMVGARGSIAHIEAIVRDSRYRPALLREASIGLGLLGDKAVVPELARMLAESQGQSAQASIAGALGYIGDERSVEPLVAMLARKDITDSARGFAAVALGIVCDREPLPWTSRISRDLNYGASTATLIAGNGTGILEIL